MNWKLSSSSPPADRREHTLAAVMETLSSLNPFFFHRNFFHFITSEKLLNMNEKKEKKSFCGDFCTLLLSPSSSLITNNFSSSTYRTLQNVPALLVKASKKFNDCVWLRKTSATLIILLLGVSNANDMVKI
jgi:hypothetical protein